LDLNTTLWSLLKKTLERDSFLLRNNSYRILSTLCNGFPGDRVGFGGVFISVESRVCSLSKALNQNFLKNLKNL
jgi:hypothetical protein